jgi:hypothetical protein
LEKNIMTRRFFKVIFISGLFLASITNAPPVQADNTTEIIRTQVEQITTSGELSVGDEGIASVSVLPEKRFPYMLRQDPGPRNALGLIKIMFPNKHLVYLHDTPSRSLFEREDRTFSSGCIRVEKPFELAELLLDNPAKWNQESIKAVIESKKPYRISCSIRHPLVSLPGLCLLKPS